MSKKFRLDSKIGFQNMFYTKCINVIIDSIGPSIILRSINRGFIWNYQNFEFKGDQHKSIQPLKIIIYNFCSNQTCFGCVQETQVLYKFIVIQT